MFRRRFPFASVAVPLAAAFLLPATPGFAGDRVRAGSRSTLSASAAAAPSQPAYAPRATVVTVSLAMPTPSPTGKEQASVSLRGPDGQTRRYAVEGGPSAIQAHQVIVRAGESVTIRVTAR
jgi:hypothetical protein